MSITEEIESSPVQIKVPVQWGDMDSAQHVNNIIYLRWTESSRIAYFGAIGIGNSFQSETGPILGWHDCKYIYPLTFPDTAIITCRAKEIKEDRIILESKIYSEKYQKLAAISLQVIIPYDYTQLKKTSLPATWKDAIDNLEK